MKLAALGISLDLLMSHPSRGAWIEIAPMLAGAAR